MSDIEKKKSFDKDLSSFKRIVHSLFIIFIVVYVFFIVGIRFNIIPNGSIRGFDLDGDKRIFIAYGILGFGIIISYILFLQYLNSNIIKDGDKYKLEGKTYLISAIVTSSLFMLFPYIYILNENAKSNKFLRRRFYKCFAQNNMLTKQWRSKVGRQKRVQVGKQVRYEENTEYNPYLAELYKNAKKKYKYNTNQEIYTMCEDATELKNKKL